MTKEHLLGPCVCWIVVCGVVGCAARLPVQTWDEDSFEDFADGTLDASGQNIYVDRNGTVRTIHRFDLNQDGYLDLVFNNTHDSSRYIPATLATVAPGGAIHEQPLAVQGSQGVVATDLNRDGVDDLLFCPNPSGIQHPRRFLTIIWGGADGWPASRSHGLLPARAAQAVAAADLNADGWPDIAVLNGTEAWRRGQPDGKIIRIYWGRDDGFFLTRRAELGVAEAHDLAAGDLDEDGADDLAVLTDKHVRVFWAGAAKAVSDTPQFEDVVFADGGLICLAIADVNADGHLDLVAAASGDRLTLIPGKKGRSWGDAVALPVAYATDIAVADLDADGSADLVLAGLHTGRAAGGEEGAATRSGAVRVLWGSSDGFSADRSTVLAADHASAVAAGDLDGDGRADLAVAVYQGSQMFRSESLIYINAGSRKFRRADRAVGTSGANDVAIVAAGDGSRGRAIFCNSQGGTIHEKVPIDVYWGGRDGFDPKRHWKVPFTSGYESSAADLNADGFVDLVLINSGHSRQAHDPTIGANIFWGGPDGFDIQGRRTVLKVAERSTSSVADLDRDGYLDMVLGSFTPGFPLVIHYGSSQGLTEGRRVDLSSPGRSVGSIIADFNRDQWLDIAVTSATGDPPGALVYYNGPDGFDAARRTLLPLPAADPIETADMNGDGWLDLLVGSYYDQDAGYHDTGSTVFWGGPKGFKHWNAQWLPGMSPCGLMVADFDADGHLDFFEPNYHGTATREALPSYLFWGGPDGLRIERKTILICDSAHGSMAADFDHDGKLDIAVSCHSQHGNHNTNSKVFYNDGRRFTQPRVTLLPTHGTHWMHVQDVGHIYHRRWEQTYESSVFHWQAVPRYGRLAYEAQVPKGTKLHFAVRAATKPQELELMPWRDVTSKRFKLSPIDRCLQYRAIFKSDNGDRYPVLDRVRVSVATDPVRKQESG